MMVFFTVNYTYDQTKKSVLIKLIRNKLHLFKRSLVDLVQLS
jgi:hypothetical protein